MDFFFEIVPVSEISAYFKDISIQGDSDVMSLILTMYKYGKPNKDRKWKEKLLDLLRD